MISVSGIDNLTNWPSSGAVVHTVPSGDVSIVSELFNQAVSRAVVSKKDGTSVSFSASQDTIVIPASALADALTEHSVILLEVYGRTINGYIKFLPQSESEDYVNQGFIIITSGGLYTASDTFVTTDFIDIQDAVEMVVTAVTYGSACPLYAYDEFKTPIEPILQTGTYESEHVVVNPRWKYVRASALISSEKSLIVYYRD